MVRQASSIQSSLAALFIASRPHNGAACALLFLAGLAWRGALHITMQTIAMVLLLFCFAAAAHLVNDIFDLAVDRINRPWRALPSGLLRLQVVRRGAFVAWLAGCGIGVAMPVGWWGWWLFWAVAGPGYSLIAKGRGWLAPLWTGLVIASCWLAGAGLHALRTKEGGAIFLAVTYFIVFREYVKNLEDMRGDRLAGLSSFAGGHWDRRGVTWLLALPIIVAGACALWLVPGAFVFKVIGALFLGLLLAAICLLSSNRRGSRHLSGSLLKGGAFCGLGILLLVNV